MLVTYRNVGVQAQVTFCGVVAAIVTVIGVVAVVATTHAVKMYVDFVRYQLILQNS